MDSSGILIDTFLGLRQRLYLFEGIPHVSAKINGKEVLLLLDTGAGGTDLMLYSRFSEGFNLRRNGGLSIRGINTKGMEVHSTVAPAKTSVHFKDF